jgi:hypothetical protein
MKMWSEIISPGILINSGFSFSTISISSCGLGGVKDGTRETKQATSSGWFGLVCAIS